MIAGHDRGLDVHVDFNIAALTRCKGLLAAATRSALGSEL